MTKSKLCILGAGAVGAHTLGSLLRMFPNNQKIEIIFHNRTLEKAIGVTEDTLGSMEVDNIIGKYQRRSKLSNITITPTSDIKAISGSGLILCTTGISAAILNSKTREAALPVTHRIMTRLGDSIKEYAPDSTVFLATNPVDILTKVMADQTGFPAGRVIGSSTEIDARRFRRFFFYELQNEGFKNIVNIQGEVIGGHSASSMIVVKDSIRIIDKESEKRISDFSQSNQEKIQQAFDKAEKKMQDQGFRIIELTNSGSSFEPGTVLASMAIQYLFGKDVGKITGSMPLSDNNSYYNISSPVLSVPLSIKKGSIKIDEDRFKLSPDELLRLQNVALVNTKILADVNGVSVPFQERAEKGFKELTDLYRTIKESFRSEHPNNVVSQAIFTKIAENQNDQNKNPTK